MPFEIIDDVAEFHRARENPDVRVKIEDNSGHVTHDYVDHREEWDYEPEPEESFDADYVIQRSGELMEILPSTFTEFAIMMPDKRAQTYRPFSFEGRRYLRHVYDSPSKRTLLKCGRQVEKSTMLGNKLLSYSCIIQALGSLYVSPTNQQTKVFSQDRLKEPVETSPYLKTWTTTKLSDNVFLKKFINRSQITLRYCYQSADRVRGIPADLICIDELQDILTDSIPVIEECASHSPFKIFIYSGTPKSLDNPIEYYWTELSTQNEWIVPCHRHAIQTGGTITKAHWNILDEDNIGKKGLVCDKCHKLIQPMVDDAKWVALNNDVYKKIPNPYEGFRIPQLMVPWLPWDEILQKQHTYDRGKFYNEVLGLSYDSGQRPLTRRDVQDNCDPNIRLNPRFQEKIRKHVGGSIPMYLGIDWGTGENSYTVAAFGCYLQDRFSIVRIKRYEGREQEPDTMMDLIMQDFEKWRVRRAGCDYGGGFWPNDKLINRFGWDRVAKYQYSSPSDKVRWDDGLKRFMVNRTEVMSDIFNAIKRRDVFRFPDWEDFNKPFAQDMLNIFSEYSDLRRENVYKKVPNVTDDSFHAILLCFLVSMIDRPRPDIMAPMRDRASHGQ